MKNNGLILYYNIMLKCKNLYLIITGFVIILLLLLIMPLIFKNKKIKEGLETNEFIPTPNTLLFEKPIDLKRNLGITFCMILNNENKGDWKQIIGITPSKDGSDKRIFIAALCPGGNKLAFRTASIDNLDEGILNCSVNVPINQYIRIDVLSNSMESGRKQNIIVNMTNLSSNEKAKEIANVILPTPKYIPSNGFKEGWVFTSYKNVTDVIDGKLKNVAIVTGDTKITIDNLDNVINYAKDNAIKKT